MKSLFYLAAITALASSVSAAAIAKPVEMANPDDYTITVYPDGLPAELVPHAKRDTSLDKRATEAAYFCTDINFGGYCVDVQGSLYQCSRSLSSTSLRLPCIAWWKAKSALRCIL